MTTIKNNAPITLTEKEVIDICEETDICNPFLSLFSKRKSNVIIEKLH